MKNLIADILSQTDYSKSCRGLQASAAAEKIAQH
jgi:hypothetical protein